MGAWGWVMDRLTQYVAQRIAPPDAEAQRRRILTEQDAYEYTLRALHAERHADERRYAWEERGRPDG